VATPVPADAIEPFAAPSVFESIASIYGFLADRRKQVIAAVAVPLGLAFIVLLLTLRYYFSTLAVYLALHDVRTASHAVSATVVGLLLWLLLNVIACGRLTRLVAGEPPQPWFDIRPHALEATINAAVLRFLLVLVAAGALAAELATAGARLVEPAESGLVVVSCLAALAAFAFVFVVRCGLLLPALSYHRRRQILRRGWEYSGERFWHFAAVATIAVLLPSFLLQFLGEIGAQFLVADHGEAAARTFAEAAAILAKDGAEILVVAFTLSISSAVCLTLWTIASGLIYRSLTEAG